MEKTSLEIISVIHSELEEILGRVGELDRRLSQLLGETPLNPEEPQAAGTREPVEQEQAAAITEPAEEPQAAGAREPAEQTEEMTAGEGPAFDIMMDDDVDFISAAGKSSAGESAKAEQWKTEKQEKDGPEVSEKVEPAAGKPAKSGKAPKAEKEEKPARTAKSARNAEGGKAEPRKMEKKPAAPDQSRVPAWKTDAPASPLSNILSGISLKERMLLINSLFKEDAQMFIDTVSAFNAMKSLDEAEAYIISRFPSWKLDSDNVYRLMMAVRRKLK